MRIVDRTGSWMLAIAFVLLCCLPYLPWVSSYFVADDWSVLARNRLSWAEVPQWFLASRFSWYRPLFDLYIAIGSRVFGLNPLGYHVASIILYVIVSALVGILGLLLTGDRRVGALAALIFALHSCHSTAVMWIASANELLAGVFALASITFYVAHRQNPRWYKLAGAVCGCVLAITAKETALFVPVAFLVYSLIFDLYAVKEKPRLGVFWPLLLLLVLVGIHTLRVLPAAASSITFDVVQIARNLAYYMAMQLLTVPKRFSEMAASPLAASTVFLAATSLLIVGLVLVFTRKAWLRDQKRTLTLVFCVVLSLVALGPVIFVVTERTAFLSSAGIALAFALLFVNAWDDLARRRTVLWALVLIALVLWVGANTVTLVRRNARWGEAGAASRSVFDQLGEYAETLPGDTQIWLLGLPDHIENAYAFRNVFPKAAQVLGYEQMIHVVLDTELDSLPAADKAKLATEPCDSCRFVVLWYENGGLVPAQP